ncbi:MAG: hypothetical protein D6705_17445 [Deltaproteobacteria bacterium]|nr:MAG: hypothetical protein D6705_17445 [Deltaproteobacteria bacterium]
MMRQRFMFERALCAVLWVAACSQGAGDGKPGDIPYERLSDYGFFVGDLRDLEPAAGVVPYRVVSPLWADHAGKARFVVLPEGEKATFDPGETWSFPPGTIVIKNFFFDLDRRDPGGEARIVETRLLVRDETEGWVPYTYIWAEDESDAYFHAAGDRIEVHFVDENGAEAEQEYIVPNTDECDSCHARDDETHLLGLVTPQVNFEGELGDGTVGNQLERLADAGIFDGPIPATDTLPRFVDPFGTAPLTDRVRSYLHANCSHCHRPGGDAAQAGLDFTAFDPDPLPAKLGVCKEPVAAGPGTGGREYDVVPGLPDESILVYRMESTDPETRMPELPIRIPHADGIALVREWITSMEPVGCGTP